MCKIYNFTQSEFTALFMVLGRKMKILHNSTFGEINVITEKRLTPLWKAETKTFPYMCLTSGWLHWFVCYRAGNVGHNTPILILELKLWIFLCKIKNFTQLDIWGGKRHHRRMVDPSLESWDKGLSIFVFNIRLSSLVRML